MSKLIQKCGKRVRKKEINMKTQPACPECEKLSAVSEESNKIGDFLEWLSSKGLVIAGYDRDISYFEQLVVVRRFQGSNGINRVLAEYYGIDLDKVKKERSELLKWLQSQHEEKS